MDTRKKNGWEVGVGCPAVDFELVEEGAVRSVATTSWRHLWQGTRPNSPSALVISYPMRGRVVLAMNLSLLLAKPHPSSTWMKRSSIVVGGFQARKLHFLCVFFQVRL